MRRLTASLRMLYKNETIPGQGKQGHEDLLPQGKKKEKEIWLWRWALIYSASG